MQKEERKTHMGATKEGRDYFLEGNEKEPASKTERSVECSEVGEGALGGGGGGLAWSMWGKGNSSGISAQFADIVDARERGAEILG